MLHLHHLTPIHEAAARVAPGVPIVGHLHGTELLMLEAIEADPDRWPHAAAWAARLRAWARACARVIVLTETQVARAEALLGLDAERCVLVPNGFDPEAFRPGRVDQVAHWRRHLVDEPQGWAPGEDAGSVAYADADLAAFAGRARRCCSTSGASPTSSACRCSWRRTRRRSPGSRPAPRW